MTSQILVELFYDDESRNWGFRVPSLNINGGADTKAAAYRQAVEAVAFTLSCTEDESPERGYVTERAYVSSTLISAAV